MFFAVYHNFLLPYLIERSALSNSISASDRVSAISRSLEAVFLWSRPKNDFFSNPCEAGSRESGEDSLILRPSRITVSRRSAKLSARSLMNRRSSFRVLALSTTSFKSSEECSVTDLSLGMAVFGFVGCVVYGLQPIWPDCFWFWRRMVRFLFSR